MSIGGTLAGARHQAGLTVEDVSARTRIRAGLIRAIEQDEFGSCGGDFYARGHIRAISAAVGADPRPLISEYDAAHPAGRPVTMDDLLSGPPPGEPPREPRRRGPFPWLVPVVLLFWLGSVGFASYQVAAGTSGPQRPPAAAPRHPAASPGRAPSSSPASPRPVPTVVPVRELTPVRAAAFGPGGTSDGDNPGSASLALSGDPATPWHTSWYTTARFGNLQAGTGLLVDLGRTVTATRVTVRLGNASGADLQVRAGTSVGHLHTLAKAADTGGTVRLRLASHPRVRYVLIWFTLLPPDAAGTYQADISSVRVTAYAG